MANGGHPKPKKPAERKKKPTKPKTVPKGPVVQKTKSKPDGQ